MNRGILVLTVGLLSLAACKHLERSVSRGEIKQSWSKIDDADFIRARGVGAAPREAKDSTQRKGMSLNAGRVAARYELLGRLKGLKLDGGLTVAQLMQTDSAIRERADDLIKGAEEASVEWTSDGGVVVVLQVPRSAIERLAQPR